MSGIDWDSRRDAHTIKAIRAAMAIDWPEILLRIYYPCMSAYSQPPLHYIITTHSRPVTRKQSETYSGMVVMFMPNEAVEVIFR